MNPSPDAATSPRRRDRRWYTLGIIGAAIGLLAVAGLAGVTKILEANARMQ